MEMIEKIWLTDDAVWIRTADGREACEKFADYPRLRYATKEQRANYEADEYGGRKNASEARVTQILDTVREIGQELIAV